MVSCKPEIPDDDKIEKFEQWYKDFNSAVVSRSDLEDYVENYAMIWRDLDPGPDLSLLNAGGQKEFLIAFDWFNANFGSPKDITILEAQYNRRSYPHNHKYSFELKVQRQFTNTKELYMLWETDGNFKLLLIRISIYPSPKFFSTNPS